MLGVANDAGILIRYRARITFSGFRPIVFARFDFLDSDVVFRVSRRSQKIEEEIRPGKVTLQKIVRMLMGLIKRNSTREYDKGIAAK
jgi:hypothetical protein